MLFTDVALLRDDSNKAVLAAGIKQAMETLQIVTVLPDVVGLILWILFMGNIAAVETDNNKWFKISFARELAVQQLYHFETVRRVLIEFLYVEAVLDAHFKAMQRWKSY